VELKVVEEHKVEVEIQHKEVLDQQVRQLRVVLGQQVQVAKEDLVRRDQQDRQVQQGTKDQRHLREQKETKDL